MLADPQSVTINSVAEDYDAVGRSQGASTYLVADGDKKLEISHQTLGNGRIRSLVRLTVEVVTADPFNDGLNKPYSMTAYMVIDRPKVGFTTAEAELNAHGLVDYLDGGTILADVIAGQS